MNKACLHTSRVGVMVVGVMVVAVITAATVALSGCGGQGDDESGAMAALRARHELGATAKTFRDVAELLMNTKFATGEATAEPVTDAVVRGTVVDVAPGRAFTVEGPDAPDGTLTDFDDASASWRTFHLTVNVVETLSGSTSGNLITVGVAFGPDTSLERVRADMEALGEVVLFLNHTPVFNYDKSVYGTVGDGAYIAPIDSAGTLTLPALDPQEAALMLRRGGSVAALRTAAKSAPVVVQLDATGTQRLSR